MFERFKLALDWSQLLTYVTDNTTDNTLNGTAVLLNIITVLALKTTVIQADEGSDKNTGY